MKRGALLAFEGLDGSGKSTQAALLAAALRAAGHEVVTTREPTHGPYGQRLRALASGSDTASPEEELRWFTEDRRAHVREVIAPALVAGQVVVTDRYFLSTVAYQTARGAASAEEILALSEGEFPLPDLAILLVLEPGEGLHRVRTRGGETHHVYEQRQLLARVAEVYAGVDRPYVERIDARGEADAVHREIMRRVQKRTGLV